MVKLSENITVGTTAQKLVYGDSSRTSLSIYNNDASNRVFIGADENVTTSNGFPIPPKTPVGFLVGLGDEPDLEYWAIAETAPVDVRILEQRGYDPRADSKEVK